MIKWCMVIAREGERAVKRAGLTTDLAGWAVIKCDKQIGL